MTAFDETPGARRMASAGQATAIGATAILMWSSLALLSTLAGPVPPFLLTTLSFAIASAVAFAVMAGRALAGGPSPLAALRQPPAAWMVGAGGLFGYHALYFLAVQGAPPVEASLIAYLWPLLLVGLSALLPGERLVWRHVVGALLGLAGAALLVTGGKAVAFRGEHAVGHLAALGCAVTWAAYSVLSRRLGAVPTEAVGGFCAATALLAAVAHLLLETTRWPDGATAWLAVAALGIGPVGAAFFAWDHGVKRGDIHALGVLSYAAPLLSTVLLVACGLAPMTWVVGAACLLIVGGALLASLEMLRR